MDEIQRNPDSRRLIVSAWNVAELPKMALMPCHTLFQFYVAQGRLSCQLYQRSGDIFLGVPFNIASYALLTHMIARVTDTDAHEFILQLGDAHVYRDHVDALRIQLEREPRPFPKLRWARSVDSIDGFTAEDIVVEGYNPHPSIAMKMSV